VKITHHPLPPIDSDSDDELDSDMENEMGDGSELGDEVEGGKGKMVNGVGGDEVDEDGDADGQGDEDDEAHEDDEYSDDEVEETVVLCSLIPGKVSYFFITALRSSKLMHHPDRAGDPQPHFR